MDKNALAKIGLSNAESTIYLSLSKLGESSVKSISKDTGFHRTNIYDILEQLKEKGLVSFIRKGKVFYYSTTDPKNLFNLIEKRKEVLDNLMPDLEKLKKTSKEKINVSLFKGEEGMISVYNDMRRDKGIVYGLGIMGQLRAKLPDYANLFLRDLKLDKRKYYALYDKKENISPVITEVRILPKEIKIPAATQIYSNKVLITIWEPDLIAILIESKEVAESYLNFFNLLWKISKPLKINSQHF